MRGAVLNYHHSYSLFFFVILILFRHAFSIYFNILSSTESLNISSNRTIVSRGDVFELGFFRTTTSSGDGDRWYLGIWYKKIAVRTYVWVANRENPLSNSIGTLRISDTNLVIFNQSDIAVWSTNLTGTMRSPIVAELLDNGNFVLRYSNTDDPSRFLWQSFDFPTDTLLPQMKMGWDLKTGQNRFLRSWRSPYDPSSGDLSYKVETRGLPEFYLRKRNGRVYRSGPWDGNRFSGQPEMQQWSYNDIFYTFTESREEVAYTFRVTDRNMYSRLTIGSTGLLELLTWNILTSREWNIYWFSPKDQCDMYGQCGPYSYCDTNISPICNCIRGFVPRDLKEWQLTDTTSGCVRKTQLSCRGDGFFLVRNVKLPDTTTTIVDRRIGLKECEQRCVRDCNCTAFANTDIRIGGSGCVIWTGELFDIRKFAAAGQDLYVRLAADDLVFTVPEKANNNSGKTRTIIGLSVGATVLVFLSFVIFFFWRKHKQARAIRKYRHRRHNLLADDTAEDLELPLMEYDVVAMATNDFANCNKLGEGGFGAVYKGRLLDGEEIAVKRLSEVSTQGTTEFATEMKLIAKLQHINLVRLLGCYADADEKILVYEYLENLSLDYYLFDKTKSAELNWPKRFDIIKGIARGLLYLHQDSRCRVIHRDLKASNILLDKDMIPKISDFGMARIFARDEEEATTRRIVGTYGYMSPEYAMGGIYSEKSDVFSFGVLLLEIVSGRKCRRFTSSDLDSNLLSFVWRNMEEGTGHNVIDPNILDFSSPSPTYQPDEILRCIIIGLTCVQEYAEDRPTMSWVVLMLGSETKMRKPRPPAYCVGRSPCDTESSSSNIECTISEITPR